MAITLAQAKVGMANKVDQTIVDTFRRSSLLLDMLVFDDAISPGTGGSTLAYGYIQLKTPSTAGVRAINEEYVASEAIREEKTTKAAIIGGAFEIDRVIAETSGAIDELAFQATQKIKATASEFSNLVINGVKGEKSFDGLSTLLSGTDMEISSTVDLSTSALVDDNYNALLDEVDAFLAEFDGTPSMLLMNSKMLGKMRSAARRAGYFAQERNEFGKVVEKYNDVPMIDAGKYFNGTNTVDIIPVEEDGTTAIYGVVIGLDGFHGISPTGNKVIVSRMPDLSAPGVMKRGDVELVAGVALKNTRKAGVLKGIKIDAGSAEG